MDKEPRRIFCNTLSEIPTSGLIQGDIFIVCDTQQMFMASSSTTVVEKGAGGSGITLDEVKEDADIAGSITHSGSTHAPSDAQKNSNITKEEVESVLIGEIASHTHAGGGGPAFPVGSVFIAVVSTNPSTLLGYGTWTQIAGGKMLIGQTVGDADFDTAEETGGEKTHTLSAAEMPAHTHTENAPSSASGGALKFGIDTNASGSQDSGIVTGSTGSGTAHNNMPPYLVVYIWKRTA